MGCARDIVERAGAARFYFSNFPLGHSSGKPHDSQSQTDTLRAALSMFDSAKSAPTTITSPQIWAENDAWEADFWKLDGLDEQKLAKLKEEHERVRAVAAGIRKE